MKVPIAEFKKYATWSKDCYTRNCIAENDAFELILICWDKKQSTEIHDHGGEECWVCILEGEFKENIYKEDEKGELKVVERKEMKPGDITYMIDFMGYHNLENTSDKKSMSLHLYAKPIKKCNVYNPKKDKFVCKELTYDSVHNLIFQE